jgi:hypothetical protein
LPAIPIDLRVNPTGLSDDPEAFAFFGFLAFGFRASLFDRN